MPRAFIDCLESEGQFQTKWLPHGPTNGADAFISQPYANDAVRLRLWDDLGKDPEMKTEPVSHYLAYVRQCL